MIYDISMNVTPDIQVYNNNEGKQPVFETQSNHIDNNFHETLLHINVHTGTHVDYPLHMVKDGKVSSDYPVDAFTGKAKVFDMTSCDKVITKDDIIDLDIDEGDIVLFKTTNSFEDTFNFEFVYVDQYAATYLKEKKVKAVGVDGLGIERAQEGHPTHKTLLENDILIIEGLRLKDIEEDTYQLVCLPIKLANVDASLARAILIK